MSYAQLLDLVEASVFLAVQEACDRWTPPSKLCLPNATMDRLRLMAVLAHPDDESLGFGGVLAKDAAAGVETFVITATRGGRGRYRGLSPGDARPPGSQGPAGPCAAALPAAASALGGPR